MNDIESDAKNELLFKKVESSIIDSLPIEFLKIKGMVNNSESNHPSLGEALIFNSEELNKAEIQNSEEKEKQKNKKERVIHHRHSHKRKSEIEAMERKRLNTVINRKTKDEISHKTVIISNRLRIHYNEIYFNDNSTKENQKIEFWYENFGHLLSKKSIEYYHKTVNDTFINLMYLHYMKCECGSRRMIICQDKMFINLVKIFILKMGICDKKLYEEILRNLIYKNNEMNFEKFMNCFIKILKFQDDNTFLKYKFLLNINQKEENQQCLSVKELQNFFNMINCDKRNENINKEITTNMINLYCLLYNKEYPKKFEIDRLNIILEYYFDNK